MSELLPDSKLPQVNSLRQKAEEKLLIQHAVEPIPQPKLTDKSQSEVDYIKLRYELEVHQIELEMQNEELCLAKEKAENAAKIYADLYEEIYDFSPSGYFNLSSDGNICAVNLSGAKMLGKERSNLTDHNFRLFVSQKTLPVFNDFFHEIFETKIKQVCEVSLDVNERLPIFVQLEGIVYEGGNKCLLTVIDITGRKQAEVALKENELRLQELNATKDKFLSIIAHDLKSPFNSIIGFSNLLVDKIRNKNTDGIEEYAVIIQNSSQRAMDLLANLLEWARSQTGRIEFLPEYVDTVALINQVTNLLHDSAQAKSITITSELPGHLIAFADQSMISTVLRNLISNAIKFTHPGGKIIISAIQKPGEIILSVADDGVGIKKDSLRKLFRIENHCSTSGTQKEKGTGLGLILCNEFVEKHGGKIWVESEPDKGSTFYFSIPKN